jgi:hypothetical protein
MCVSLFEYIANNGNGPVAFSDHDLAVMADWAHAAQKTVPNPRLEEGLRPDPRGG